MRHQKRINHLGRTTPHRKAMLSNMACSLIENKRINTTLAKAKALKLYIEPLITKSKTDSTHSRRTVFSYLQSKEAIKELFSTISVKIAQRPGGYTRILKTGTRAGDNAEMGLIELVDFNELLLGEDKTKKGSKKRTRRAGSSKAKTEVPTEAKFKKGAKEVQSEPEAKADTVSAEPQAVVETENVIAEQPVDPTPVSENTSPDVSEEKPESDSQVEPKEKPE